MLKSLHHLQARNDLEEIDVVLKAVLPPATPSLTLGLAALAHFDIRLDASPERERQQ